MATDTKKARSLKKGSRQRHSMSSVLTPDELEKPGAALIALLLERAHTYQMTVDELATRIGVSYSYFAWLRRKKDAIPKIGTDVIERIAEFLELPKVAVMLLAGHLKPSDFDQIPQNTKINVENALRFIQSDPVIGPHMPATIFTADLALQQFMVSLYEMASGRLLITSMKSAEEIVALHREYFAGKKE